MLMLRCAKRHSRPARIGAHVGEVFSGVVGDRSRLEYSVFGGPVNVAVGLQELARDQNQSVLVSWALVDRASISQGSRALDALTLRGRGAMIDVMARDMSNP